MRTTVENLYKNASYSYAELAGLLAYGFIIGFLFAFEVITKDGRLLIAIDWGDVLLYSIASILVVFLFTYIQKAVGVFVGVHASHRVSWTYLAISLLLCVVTRGAVVFFIPPILHIASQEHLLIGRKPFMMSIKNMRVFALLPILGIMLCAVAFSELLPLAPHVASTLYWVAFLTAVYSLIPIEFLVNLPLVFAREKAEKVLSEHVTHKVETRGVSLGSILWYGSHMNLFFAATFIVCSLISLITTGFWFTMVFAVLVSFFGSLIFYIKTELD